MAGSVNKVILIGNLGGDPEVRRTQDGRPIATINIATSETWRDRTSGERREKTEWHRVVIFNESLAKIAEDYLKKGAKVYVEGQLQTRKWQDNQGQDRYSTEVVLQVSTPRSPCSTAAAKAPAIAPAAMAPKTMASTAIEPPAAPPPNLPSHSSMSSQTTSRSNEGLP